MCLLFNNKNKLGAKNKNWQRHEKRLFQIIWTSRYFIEIKSESAFKFTFPKNM